MICRHPRRLFHVATWRNKTRVKTNWIQKPQASTRDMVATFQPYQSLLPKRCRGVSQSMPRAFPSPRLRCVKLIVTRRLIGRRVLVPLSTPSACDGSINPKKLSPEPVTASLKKLASHQKNKSSSGIGPAKDSKIDLP